MRRLLLIAIVGLAGCSKSDPATPEPAAPPPNGDAVREQVRKAVLGFPVGEAPYATLAPSPDFVNRLADRTLREGHRDHYHAVIADGELSVAPPPATSEERPATDGAVSIGYADWSEELTEWRQSLPSTRPINRGFRAPRRDHAARPDVEIDPELEQDWRDAGLMVAHRLATDGVLTTTAFVLQGLGPRGMDEDRLAAIGLPIDLIGHFRLDGERLDIRTLTGAMLGAGDDDGIRARFAEAEFDYIPTAAGFTVDPECGARPIERLRLQLPRGDHFESAGDGDALDVTLQLIAQAPADDIDVLIAAEHVAPFLTNLPADSRGFNLQAVPLTMTQWAQDNAKPGRNAEGTSALLVPRFASQRDEGSVHLPGDSFAVDALATPLVESPLHFQGGNVMVVEDAGERIALVGEAEVWRNVALGLRPEEVTAAMAAEFGVDRTIVLPALSFHIDYDVSFRRTASGLVAFVNDPREAVRIILQCALEPLESAGRMTAEERATCNTAAQSGDWIALGQGVDRALGRGPHEASLAAHFSTGETDSGIGNLHRVLLALDVLRAATGQPGRDEGEAAYLTAVAQSLEIHTAIAGLLQEAGWQVVPVPGLAAAGTRSLVYVNGIHTPDAYIMPVWGGLFAPLDAAAADVFSGVDAQMRIIPIRTAESQRRAGAVHCAASATRKWSGTG